MNHSRQIIISGLTSLVFLLSSCTGSIAGTNTPVPAGTVQPDQTSPVKSDTQTPQATPEISGASTATLAIPSTGGSPAAQQGSQSTSTQTQTPNPIPDFSHIFIIVMENKEAGQIIGNRFAPYLNQLGQDYARAANYYAATHPSLPNYLALTGGDTFGISTDCDQCYVNADNIASQIEEAGKTWKAYMESMPEPCDTQNASASYFVKHDPFIYYDSVRTNPDSCKNVVPFSQFTNDLQANSLPDFVWITPNICNDMHDCGIISGDNWLKTWVPKILASQAWKDNGVLFITFDEGTTRKGCCSYAAGGKVDTLVISPFVTSGFVSNNPYDHYSLLKTIETAWNLPLLGKAASDSTPLMNEFFQKNP